MALFAVHPPRVSTSPPDRTVGEPSLGPNVDHTVQAMFLANNFERWDPTSQQDPSTGGQLGDSRSAKGSYLDDPNGWTGGEGEPVAAA